MNSNITTYLCEFKKLIEDAICKNGMQGKESVIRSSKPINLIHQAIKQALISAGINKDKIYPHFGEVKPELKLAGFLKQKDQDICVLPNHIEKQKEKITWGPLAVENKYDEYGTRLTENILAINVRSQISSLEKNSDTLFERTFAEALNLHMRCPKMVLGEVYIIPVYEYADEAVKEKIPAFKSNHVNIEKYISFFTCINGRSSPKNDLFKYERCALLVVDFSKQTPKLFNNSKELKKENLISADFPLEYANINFESFTNDILDVYSKRFNLQNLY